MKQLISTILILLLCFLTVNNGNSLPINPYIHSVSPPLNANSVVKTSDIQINFTQGMNPAFMTENNIKLFGYQTGLMTALYSYNPINKTLIINPNNNFKNGEIICLTLTSGLKTISNESITPFVYSFRAKAIGGTGVFTKSSDISTLEFVYIKSGDLDGDGDIDLLIDDKIYKNDGNAIFTYYSSLNFGGRSMMADFDNDGDLDIMVRQNDDVFLMRNYGTGNFTQTNSYPGGIGSIGDLNGDGYLDISFFIDNRHINTVLNNNGIFILNNSNYMQSACFDNLANHIDYYPMINDMDNDGDLDMVGINGYGEGNSITFYNMCRTFFILNNNGTGEFIVQAIFNQRLERGGPDILFLNSSRSFDKDNDGLVDINSPVLILKNNGNGSFIENGNFVGFNNSIEADFNGDGFIDLISTVSRSPLLSYINNGDGTFTFDVLSGDNYFLRSASGDFDNDGDIDIATNNGSGVSILLNGDIPLPVALSSFTSEVNLNNVKLNWSTSGEQNNSGFEVQRSIVKNETPDNWLKAGFIKGTGSSNGIESYSYEDKNLLSGKYKYRLKQIDFNGNFEYFELANEVYIGIPDKFELKQNYPNPFNPTTNLEFGISELGFVSLKVYDALGNLVAILVNEKKEAGYYYINFDGSNLASGVYFYKIEAGNFVQTKRLLLMK
ncbi:MAG TPA: FG-GAP-like repeat-containing protein [Ignavibacteria bacterium]|nr:FG-GAP-like repeat-containing protein [Ignavibacteria bacterium]HMR42035.1 FG-GAP-like repeat-containing protein [Ignavibacteria bacterium]